MDAAPVLVFKNRTRHPLPVGPLVVVAGSVVVVVVASGVVVVPSGVVVVASGVVVVASGDVVVNSGVVVVALGVVVVASGSTTTTEPATTTTAPTGKVTGTVFEDKDRDSVQDPGEPGFPDVNVTITLSTGEIITVMTDANGMYSEVVPIGNTRFHQQEQQPASGQN